MKDDRYTLIKKPLILRLSELACSLQIINDCYTLIDNGKLYQFIPVYGQLRSILTEKSKKQRPLLFEIAELFKEELKLYYKPYEELPDYLADSVFHFLSPEISLEKEDSKQIPICLEEFLSKEVLLLNSKLYNMEFVINALANKFGGSHYASKVEKEAAQLFYFQINNQTILNQLILQISKLVLNQGIKMLQKYNSLSLYFTLYIPNQSLDDHQYLFDYYSEKYGLRYSLILNKDKTLSFKVVDIFKNLFTFSSKKPIELNAFSNIQIVFGFSKDFKSVFKLKVNDTILEQQLLDTFIPISNELHLFDKYYNRPYENEKEGLTFIQYQMLIRTTIPDNEETMSIMNYLKSGIKKSTNGILYSKGSYGLTPICEQDIKMYGKVKNLSVDQLVN